MLVKVIMGNIGLKIKLVSFYLLAGIAKIIYLLYAATIELRMVTVNSKYHPRKLPADFNVIYAFWHSKLFMIMPLGRNSRMGVVTLLDWKNFFYDKLCKVFGYRTIPLTSDPDVARKLKRMIEDGLSIGLAVDGPRGPSGVARHGAAYLAKKTKRPIISVDIKFDKSIRLRGRWDKLEIPFPFTGATLTFGEPIYCDGRSIKEVTDELKMKLGDC
jgi:hypothetical protein